MTIPTRPPSPAAPPAVPPRRPTRRPPRRHGLLAPLSVLAITGVAFVYHHRAQRPADWVDHHRRAAETVATALPLRVTGDSGIWIGRDVAPPQIGGTALRPPLAVRHVEYLNFAPPPTPDDERGGERRALFRRARLLVAVVQRDADVRVYWPDQRSGRPSPGRRRTFVVGDPPMQIDCALIDARGESGSLGDGTWAAATLLVPGRATDAGDGAPRGRSVSGIEAFFEATRSGGEYRQRRRGAATVQVLFDGPDAALPSAAKEAAAADLLSAAAPVLRALLGEGSAETGEPTTGGGEGR